MKVEVHTLQRPCPDSCRAREHNHGRYTEAQMPSLPIQNFLLQVTGSDSGIHLSGLVLPQPDARQQLPSLGSSVGKLIMVTASVMLADHSAEAASGRGCCQHPG